MWDLQAYSALRDVVTSLIATQQGESNEAWGLHMAEEDQLVGAIQMIQEGGCDSAFWLLPKSHTAPHLFQPRLPFPPDLLKVLTFVRLHLQANAGR